MVPTPTHCSTVRPQETSTSAYPRSGSTPRPLRTGVELLKTGVAATVQWFNWSTSTSGRAISGLVDEVVTEEPTATHEVGWGQETDSSAALVALGPGGMLVTCQSAP